MVTSLLFPILLVINVFGYSAKDDTLLSPYVVNYVENNLLDVFWSHPNWSEMSSHNQNNYFFYTTGTFNSDTTLDVAAILFSFLIIDNKIRLCALPAMFFFENGIVESHCILDALTVLNKPGACGLAVTINNMQLYSRHEGAYKSNCGGEHTVTMSHSFLEIHTDYSSFGYSYGNRKIKKICLFLD